MDTYEQIVKTYLTVQERRAVIPQFPVLFDDKDEPWTEIRGRKIGWSLYPDFLAVPFGLYREAQVIEVSKSMQSDNAKDLAQRTLDCRDRVERYIRWFAANQLLRIQFRFFVRKLQERPLKEALSRANISGDITVLEDVFEWVKNFMP